MCSCQICVFMPPNVSADDLDEYEYEMYDESNDDGMGIWIPEIDFKYERGSQMPERLH